ncbi:MAG: hypothetical protein EOP54_16840, partial [Sphingobacteriales bacterium]
MSIPTKYYLRAGVFNFLLVAFFTLQSCSKSTDPKPNGPIDTNFVVSNVLQSNMVLQRDKPANIWGTAKPGAAINVSVSWQTGVFNAITDNLGTWKAVIPASPANSTPQTIQINTAGKETITLDNILLGDVWICSGQSNMVMPLEPGSGGSFKGIVDYQKEIAAANYPLIRELTIKPNQQKSPLTMLDNSPVWNVCTPKVAGDISAVAYYFARKVQAEVNVPIGIIIAAMNGTKCEFYANKEAFNEDPEVKEVYGSNRDISVLYNGMLNPLINLSIKGFNWYQGESNWSDGPLQYAKLNAALIKGWRAKFNQGQLPFYFVQLAPFAKNHNTEPGGGDLTLFDYAIFREGQENIPNLVPGTGMALTTDVGDILRIHPIEKRQVGERLALFALKNDYGKNVNPYG